MENRNPETEEKQFYSIGETAKMFNVSESLLRFWEEEFDLLCPFKNKRGVRFFSRKDLEIIRTIHYLTKIKGYTLKGAKERLKSNLLTDSHKAEAIQSLLKIKELLLKIKEGLS
ncbi:MAG: MerR family transcriptional regulator [Bacteroidales bacterium]|jgi:DNA-binding transcriptional MerR regulator|nr:MerR family transcriptional regulator [Bacteroidales bacterium]